MVLGALRRILPTWLKQIVWRAFIRPIIRLKTACLAGAYWITFWGVVQPLRKSIYDLRSVLPRWVELATLHYLFTRPSDGSASGGSRQMNYLLSLPVDHDALVIQFRRRAWQYVVNAGEVEAIENRIMRIRNARGLSRFVSPSALFSNTNVHCYLDAQVKAALLDNRASTSNPQYMPLNADLRRLLNQTSYDLWDEYFDLIDSKDFVASYGKEALLLLHEPTGAVELQGRMRYVEFAKCEVNKVWEAQEDRAPLFVKDANGFGFRDELAQLGLPHDAWFVVLHVRDSGCKTGSWKNSEPVDGLRNADIDSYSEAIDFVREMGGFVVRVGDPAMKPYCDESRLVSYWSSDIRTPELDRYLFTHCRLFVGTSSGPILTPVMFGVPTVGTNFFPFMGRLNASNTITVPKKYRCVKSGRILSAEESLSVDGNRGLGGTFADLLPKLGLAIVDNSPSEIADAVSEALGAKSESSVLRENRAQIDALYDTLSGYGSMGKIGGLWLENLQISKHL